MRVTVVREGDADSGHETARRNDVERRRMILGQELPYLILVRNQP